MSALKPTHLKETFEKFGKYVVQQARTNLTKKKKNVSKTLYDSIQYKETTSQSGASFSFDFLMEEYGEFQDKGVRGKSSSSKAPNSPFKFGSGTGKKGGLTEAMQGYVKRRKIQFRDRKTGKFLSYKSTAFLISRSIYQKGIKPSLFFTKPFVAAFKRLPDELLEAYSIGLEKDLIKLTQK